jgi:hypothetical protein
MDADRTGAREAQIAGLSFGFLFLCMFGLLAASESREQGRTEAVASVAVNAEFVLASQLRLAKFSE